jgi:Tfp pilus assembly protein PilF
MSPAIRQNLAIVYRSEGRHEEALEELELAITIDPNFARAYDAIATIEYQVFNRMTRAARAFVKAIELNPTSPSEYAFLGQLYLELGEPDRSSILFDQSHKLVPDSFGAFWGQLLFQVYQADLDSIAASAEGIFSAFHRSRWEAQFTAAQLRNQALINEQIAQAEMVYSQQYPELLEVAEVVIGLHNYRAAIDLSLVLQKSGEELKASQLLAKCQDFIRDRPRLGWWGGYWISDVQILALQGRKAEALTALQRAAEEGWRSLWWYYMQYDPNLDSIRSEPVFQAVMAEIKTDMSNQMQRIRDMEQSGEIESIDGITFDSE